MSLPIQTETMNSTPRRQRRIKTPTVLQMEAVECGAAALKIVLDYYGRIIPLEKLRVECGVSRDGSKASNMVKIARRYGLTAKGYSKEPAQLASIKLPFIVFWNFNHFVVVEGFSKTKAYINDPALGRRSVTTEEFDLAFTGLVIAFELTPEFRKGGHRPSLWLNLWKRLEGSRSALAFVVLAGLFLVIPGIVLPTLTRIFIDYVLVGQNDWLSALLLMLGVVAVLRGGLTWLQQYYLLRLETKLAITTSGKFLWHLLSLPVQFFTERFPGEIGARVSINDSVARILSEKLAVTILNLFLALFYVFLMVTYDLRLTLIGLTIAAFNLATLRYTARLRVDANHRVAQERGKLLGITYNGMLSMETIKATGAESDFFALWAGYYAKASNATRQLGLFTAIINTFPAFLSALNMLIILAVGALRVMDGALSLGMLVAFQGLMVSFLTPFNDFVSFGSLLQEVEGNVHRLDDVLDYPAEAQVEVLDNQVPLPTESLVRLSGLVEIKNISFGYNKLTYPLIENFSLTIAPGQRVALVGASGSGKSTVAKLIAGLYEPWSGEINFDGRNRRNIPRAVLSGSLAIVDQDIELFAGSMRDNLSLWDSIMPDMDIVQAAQDADIHNMIIQRGGYDALLEETGRNLSGGQRQRIEIARALTLNPSILILDEAMSALDPIVEKTIDDNLQRRGCTCLIVAHRLSTIRDCDEIIVMDRGSVVERGTHQDLIRTKGPYLHLIQSEEYEDDNKKTPLDRLIALS